MREYIGLDVSLKETAISVRRGGKRIWRGKMPLIYFRAARHVFTIALHKEAEVALGTMGIGLDWGGFGFR